MYLEISPQKFENNIIYNESFEFKSEYKANDKNLVEKLSELVKSKISSFSLTRPNKIKPKHIKFSFGSVFLRWRTRLLYFKTVKQQHRDVIEDIESSFSYYLQFVISKIERREKHKRFLAGNFSLVVPMAYRLFCYTKVFITHGFRNTFITIFRGDKKEDEKNQFNMLPVTKYSCGSIGYQGPKKSTTFARKEVIKIAGNFLGTSMTTLLTVVFTSKVSRWNRKTIRNLCPNLSFVLTIYIFYKRSHGFIKYKNKRRT